MGKKYDQLDQDELYALYRLYEDGKAPAEIGRLYAASAITVSCIALAAFWTLERGIQLAEVIT